MGEYPIGKGTLTAGSNYELTVIEGVLTITKAILTVKADDQVILAGDPIPEITFTYSGWKYPEDNPENVFGTNGPAYTINPDYTGLAGTYSIIPSASAQNYEITTIPGHLYVNPSGSGAKAIRPVLLCIDIYATPVGGYSYVAHFKYENKNSTDVYIPVGPNNQISGKGKFNPSGQPTLFLSGGGTFDVPFDGLRIVWQVTSLESGRKTSVASEASSSSSRCSNKNASVNPAEILSEDQEIELIPSVYPNPASQRVTIRMNSLSKTLRITVMDLRGSYYPVSKKSQSDNELELDIAILPPGLYVITVYSETQTNQFRVIKTE